MNYHVATVLSDEGDIGFTEFLEKSCNFFHIPLHRLKAPGNYTTHQVKDQLLLSLIKKLPDHDVILFVDGYDSLFLAPLEEVIEKFNQVESEAVFSAEMTCWPDPTVRSHYENLSGINCTSPYRYLNSGGFIGRTGFIRQVLDMPIEIPKEYAWSNQYAWTLRFLRTWPDIKLDHTCEIFFVTSINLEKVKLFYGDMGSFTGKRIDFYHPEFIKEGLKGIMDQMGYENRRIISKLTGSNPCHLHLNSSVGKVLMKSEFLRAILPWSRVNMT